MTDTQAFQLRKWYVDAVSAGGEVLIAYWAKLAFHGLSVVWQSVSTYTPEEGVGPVRRSSLRAGCEPSEGDGTIQWQSEALELAVTMRTESRPLAIQLWGDGDAAHPANGGRQVRWHCVAPTGILCAQLPGGRSFTGVGYAECLTMNIAPWRLPISELRWGRWTDATASRSLVWIEWRSARMSRWVFLDGAAVDASVTDEGVAGPECVLALSRARRLDDMSIAATADAIPGLRQVLPAALLGAHDTRWLSRGVLSGGDAVAVEGIAVHELVVFPRD